jgi:UDP-glucose 4-epimerase
MLEIMEKPNHPVEHVAERPGDVRRHMADVTKLKELVGRQPEVLNTDALAETIEWYERSLG